MEDINLKEEIKKLVELQQIDAEIFSIRIDLEAVPGRINKFHELIKEREVIFKGSEDKVKHLQVKRKEKEVDLGSKEEAILKNTAQLYQLKTNEDYQTKQREIDSLKADKSVLEEEILILFDEIEKGEKELNDNKKLYQEEKGKIEAEEKKLLEGKQRQEAELSGLEEQRKGFTANINKNILMRYDRILNARAGLAIVPIEGDACGGCNMNLPPQVIDETRLGKEIVICGNCSRILYASD
ncbi:MAG: C4-type zinc ribbon domain-containing protein [Candidatus Omnitrophota bacterium]